MSDPDTTRPTQPWQRFTILDLLLLQAGFAIGFSVACVILPRDDDWVGRTMAGILFGCLACGPIVLGVQFGMRGRRAWPSTGEWLWLLTTAIYGLGFALVLVVSNCEPWIQASAVIVVFLSMLGLSLLGLATLTLRCCRGMKAVPCPWSDLFGSFICLLMTGLLWLGLLLPAVQ